MIQIDVMQIPAALQQRPQKHVTLLKLQLFIVCVVGRSSVHLPDPLPGLNPGWKLTLNGQQLLVCGPAGVHLLVTLQGVNNRKKKTEYWSWVSHT